MLRTWDLSVQDTYLQRTTQVGDAEEFAHADLSPDGQRVAYSWIDGDTGWVRFVDIVTGEATPPARVAGLGGSPGPAAPGVPRVRQYVAYACACTGCGAGGRAAVVLDPATGKVLEETGARRRRRLLARVRRRGPQPARRRTPTPRPDPPPGRRDPASRGRGLRLRRVHVATPIGDGSTAMVHENLGDGVSGHWRVIDVDDGEVLTEGERGPGRARLGRLSGRLDRRAWRGTPARS